MSGIEQKSAVRMGFQGVKSWNFPSRGTLLGGVPPQTLPWTRFRSRDLPRPQGGTSAAVPAVTLVLYKKTYFWLDSGFQKPKLTVALC